MSQGWLTKPWLEKAHPRRSVFLSSSLAIFLFFDEETLWRVKCGFGEKGAWCSKWHWSSPSVFPIFNHADAGGGELIFLVVLAPRHWAIYVKGTFHLEYPLGYFLSNFQNFRRLDDFLRSPHPPPTTEWRKSRKLGIKCVRHWMGVISKSYPKNTFLFYEKFIGVESEQSETADREKKEIQTHITGGLKPRKLIISNTSTSTGTRSVLK